MWKELINNFLESISPFFVLIGFLLLRKQWKSIGFMRVLFLYCLCSSINLGIATFLAYLNGRSNIFWYDLHGFLSLLILSIFYYQILKGRSNKRLVLYLSVTGLISYIIILVYFDDRISFNSAGYSIGSFLIILYSLMFLKEVFSSVNSDPLHLEVTVWIVSALLTYFLSSFLIQLSYKYVTRFLAGNFGKGIKDSWLWGINNVLYFFANLSIIINLFRLSKLKKTNKNNPA